MGTPVFPFKSAIFEQVAAPICWCLIASRHDTEYPLSASPWDCVSCSSWSSNRAEEEDPKFRGHSSAAACLVQQVLFMQRWPCWACWVELNLHQHNEECEHCLSCMSVSLSRALCSGLSSALSTASASVSSAFSSLNYECECAHRVVSESSKC